MLHEYNKLTDSYGVSRYELQAYKVSTEDAVGSLKALELTISLILKDYEERNQKEITYEQIRSFTDQFQNNTVF